MTLMVITDGECTLYRDRNEDEMHAIYDRLISNGKVFTAIMGAYVDSE